MTFAEFEKNAHEKRVNHFVRFINAHERKATIEDCIEVFGFCESDARPIYFDAMARVVTSGFDSDARDIAYDEFQKEKGE